jgi:hypothetical protein
VIRRKRPRFNLGSRRYEAARFAASFGRGSYGAAAARARHPGDRRLRSPPYPAAAPASITTRPSASRQMRQSPGECRSDGAERRTLSGLAPPTVLRIPLRGTRLRRAVDPGDSASPAGLTARARPEARPERARRTHATRHGHLTGGLTYSDAGVFG